MKHEEAIDREEVGRVLDGDEHEDEEDDDVDEEEDSAS